MFQKLGFLHWIFFLQMTYLAQNSAKVLTWTYSQY